MDENERVLSAFKYRSLKHCLAFTSSHHHVNTKCILLYTNMVDHLSVVSKLQITIGPKCECVVLLPLTAHEFMIWILKFILTLNLCFLTAQNFKCFKTNNNFS